jgi:hypothetical protein
MDRINQVMLSRPDRSRWLYLWALVGSLMGTESGGLPNDLPQATSLLNAVQHSTEYRPTSEEQALMAALITANDGDPAPCARYC